MSSTELAMDVWLLFVHCECISYSMITSVLIIVSYFIFHVIIAFLCCCDWYSLSCVVHFLVLVVNASLVFDWADFKVSYA